jgi:hypothetical protein
VTNRMFAFGAVACAHWTSSETSRAQADLSSRPVPLLGGGALVAGEPCKLRISNVGMPGVRVTQRLHARVSGSSRA